MQDQYLLTVAEAKTEKPIIDGLRQTELGYIRIVLEDYTELGWWARRRFIRNLHKTGLSTYKPRVASDRYRIVIVTHWVDSGTI